MKTKFDLDPLLCPGFFTQYKPISKVSQGDLDFTMNGQTSSAGQEEVFPQ
jgi:hypothetical protein